MAVHLISPPYTSISPKGTASYIQKTNNGNTTQDNNTKISISKDSKNSKENNALNLSKKLSPQEEKKIQELKKIDAHVRAHEHAHIVAGGPYVRGGPYYEYIIGPDGNKYAISGEVQIDVSPVPGNPDATIRKAQIVKRAALAPPDPSPQDRAVAAKADQMALKARMEKARETAKKLNELLQKKQQSQEINPYGNIINSNMDDTMFQIIQGGTSVLKKQAFNAYSPMPPSLSHSISLIV